MRTSSKVHHLNHAAVATALLLLASPGCSDEGETLTGGAGGTGGSTASGGAGGGGGSTASGGAGGAEIACLPSSATAALFTLAADDLCAVAIYTAEGTIAYQQPTWGSHGGPLLVTQGPGDGEATLARWSPPAGAEGAMTIATTTVDAKIPAGAFVGAEALDLGFRPGTAITYSNAFPDTSGELVIVDGASSDERYAVNGIFSMLSLPTSEGVTGRLAYSGLSILGDATAGANGLYAADDCAASFDPSADPQCAEPIEVAAWGDASGPVIADRLGNTFVVMTSFAGDQIGRGFAAPKIAKGGAATSGDDLFTLDGFGQSLAAIAPAAGAPGILAFQPSDAMTFEALDVLQVRYSAGADAITVDAQPAPMITFPSPNTPVALLTDPQDRLWVGVPVKDGGTTSTTFVVLARKP